MSKDQWWGLLALAALYFVARVLGFVVAWWWIERGPR